MAIASSRSAPIGLVIGCVIFGLGSLIVAHVDVGGWAMSFGDCWFLVSCLRL